MWFYILFLLSILLFPNFRVGPFSIRIYMSLLMLIVLMYKNSKGTKIVDPQKIFMVLYVAYLLIMSVAYIMNGEIFETNYLNVLLGSYVVPMIVYYATLLYVKDEKIIKWLLLSIGFVVILTAFTTMLQFYNNPLGWGINMLFHNGKSSMLQDWATERFSNADSMIGNSYQVGIYLYGFINAAFLSSVTLLFLYPILSSKNSQFSMLFKLFCAIVVVTGVLGSYWTQQRAAFGGMLIFIFFLIFRHSRHKAFTIMVLIVGIIFVLIKGVSFVNNDSLGRLTDFNGMNEDARSAIWGQTLSFLSEHLLWGGHKALGIDPHNMFLNAFVYGGVFGGLVMSMLIIYYSLESVKCVLDRKKRFSFHIFCAAALLTYTFTGLFHNVSIADGSDLCFLLLALMLIYRKIVRRKVYVVKEFASLEQTTRIESNQCAEL